MRKIVLFIVVFLIAANNIYARDLKVSLPILPPVINEDSTGLLADLIRLLDKNYTEGKFEITVENSLKLWLRKRFVGSHK